MFTSLLFFYCYNGLGYKGGMQRVHNMEYSSAVPPGSNMQVGVFRHPPESMYIVHVQVHYTESNNNTLYIDMKTTLFGCH
jgi:hypothetical protein